MVYEYEGKTEKEAIEKAAQELGLEKDQFDVEILETQKNSLFKKGFVKIRVHTVDTPDHVAPEFEGSVPLLRLQILSLLQILFHRMNLNQNCLIL
jgi:spoIIIJ-associated protein